MTFEKTDTIIRITSDIRKLLHQYRRKSRMSPAALVKKHKSALEGISVDELCLWLENYGPPIFADAVKLERVLALWRQEAEVRKVAIKVKITDEYIQSLKDEIIRTGVSSTTFVKSHYQGDTRLKENIISTWMNKNILTAEPHLMESILECYQQLPDAYPEVNHYLRTRDKRINISARDLALLKHYRSSVCITPSLIRDRPESVPEGLSPYIISGWLNESIKTVVPEHMEWVLKRCFEILDTSYNHHLVKKYHKEHYMQDDTWKSLQQGTPHAYPRYKSNDLISPGELRLLHHYRDTSGILISPIFKDADDCPPGLNPAIISCWFSKRITSAQCGYIGWVLKRCFERLDHAFHHELVEHYRKSGNK